jgi:hypothetical protein
MARNRFAWTSYTAHGWNCLLQNIPSLTFLNYARVLPQRQRTRVFVNILISYVLLSRILYHVRYFLNYNWMYNFKVCITLINGTCAKCGIWLQYRNCQILHISRIYTSQLPDEVSLLVLSPGTAYIKLLWNSKTDCLSVKFVCNHFREQ